MIEWTSSTAIAGTCFPTFSSWSPFDTIWDFSIQFHSFTFNGLIHIFSYHCRRYSDFVLMFQSVKLRRHLSWRLGVLKQFLCSSRLASTIGKSLSAVFVASSNSVWRDVKSVITAISHFSLWSKTLHCWQKLSKSTNQRVYQDLVYRNALLFKILTSVPAPLSPVPLYV